MEKEKMAVIVKKIKEAERKPDFYILENYEHTFIDNPEYSFMNRRSQNTCLYKDEYRENDVGVEFEFDVGRADYVTPFEWWKEVVVKLDDDEENKEIKAIRNHRGEIWLIDELD